MRWLQRGRMDYLPTLLHTNMPMGVDMLFLLAQAAWTDTAAKLIHYALGLLALLALFALGRRVSGGAGVGFFAVAVFLFGLPSARTLSIMGWAYVDMGIALQLACAALAWVLWRRGEAQGWLWASALLAGFAAACKLTVGCVGAALALLTLLEMRARRRPSPEALKTGLLFLLISLLPLLPWMARALVVTGNPVYPVLAGVFPTRDWPDAAGKAFEKFFRYYVWGTGGFGSGWDFGKRKAVLLGCIGVVALVSGLWLWRDKNRDTRMLAALAALLCVASLWSTGLYLRYFLPLLPLAAIAALTHAPRKPGLVLAGRAGALAVAALAGVSFLRAARPELGPALRYATGRLSRRDYLAERFLPFPLWEFVNRTAPPDARVLLAAGRVSYYVRPHCYVTEAIYQNVIRMDSWKNYLADLERERITHVLMPPPGFSLPFGMDYAPAKNEMPFAERLASERGELLHTVAGDRFYRLRPWR